MTDACHGWRGNASQSDIIAFGQTNHRGVGLAMVTRQDDPVNQCHDISVCFVLFFTINLPRMPALCIDRLRLRHTGRPHLMSVVFGGFFKSALASVFNKLCVLI